MESLHNSQAEKISKNTETAYTLYGIYKVKDRATFYLPNNTIVLERATDDKFTYRRTNQNGTVEKLLSIRTQDLEMEFVPTLPIYVPSYKTDFVFLRLSKPVFVSRNSKTEVFVSMPIEMGLFFTGNEMREYFDVFACEPSSSRYALYGDPDKGKLCKFATVMPLAQEEMARPYFEGRLRVKIQNELDTGISIGKIVFPVRDHEIHYRYADAAYDDLNLIVKERLGVQIAEVVQSGNMPQGWSTSPRTMKKTDIKFTMEMGFD